MNGQTAVVTGGCGLLGKEFCRTLAQAGAAVVVADVNQLPLTPLPPNWQGRATRPWLWRWM
jgi:NAD(P)-dependent dehydrogenase (short-subunit alcohol dehydrogenase family)